MTPESAIALILSSDDAEISMVLSSKEEGVNSFDGSTNIRFTNIEFSSPTVLSDKKVSRVFNFDNPVTSPDYRKFSDLPLDVLGDK